MSESRLADGQLKSHTKKCLEFENNAVDCMTFIVQPTGRLDLNAYMHFT